MKAIIIKKMKIIFPKQSLKNGKNILILINRKLNKQWNSILKIIIIIININVMTNNK